MHRLDEFYYFNIPMKFKLEDVPMDYYFECSYQNKDLFYEIDDVNFSKYHFHSDLKYQSDFLIDSETDGAKIKQKFMTILLQMRSRELAKNFWFSHCFDQIDNCKEYHESIAYELSKFILQKKNFSQIPREIQVLYIIGHLDFKIILEKYMYKVLTTVKILKNFEPPEEIDDIDMNYLVEKWLSDIPGKKFLLEELADNFENVTSSETFDGGFFHKDFVRYAVENDLERFYEYCLYLAKIKCFVDSMKFLTRTLDYLKIQTAKQENYKRLLNLCRENFKLSYSSTCSQCSGFKKSVRFLLYLNQDDRLDKKSCVRLIQFLISNIPSADNNQRIIIKDAIDKSISTEVIKELKCFGSLNILCYMAKQPVFSAGTIESDSSEATSENSQSVDFTLEDVNRNLLLYLKGVLQRSLDN